MTLWHHTMTLTSRCSYNGITSIIQKLVDYGDNNTKGVVNDLLCALFKSVTCTTAILAHKLFRVCDDVSSYTLKSWLHIAYMHYLDLIGFWSTQYAYHSFPCSTGHKGCELWVITSCMTAQNIKPVNYMHNNFLHDRMHLFNFFYRHCVWV